MRTKAMGRKICLLALIVAAGSFPAAAGLDVDLGARVAIGDDADLFIGISSRYFSRDARTVANLSAGYSNPDDLSVALFLSGRTGESPAGFRRLRESGLSWWEIGVRFGVPVDAWFVPVRRAPGPPYGKAYGHWKSGKHQGMRLTDAEARNLVAVRMIHEYYGVPVEVAMEWRASGKSVRDLMNGEYRKRHGREVSKASHGKGHPDRGRPDRKHGRKK